MTLPLSLRSGSPQVSPSRVARFRLTRVASLLFALGATLIGIGSAGAQSAPQQQYVYASVPVAGTSASEVAGFSKNATGGLSSVGAPLSDAREGGALAIDAQGRFLFVLNPTSNNVSMFQINRTTGSLTEASGSPFAVGFLENPNMRPTFPAYLATEPSGQFLYVGYRNGNFQGKSAIIEYGIDSNTPRLVPPVTAAGTSDLISAPIGMFADPKGQFLYVGLGPNPPFGNPGRHNQRIPHCGTTPVDSGGNSWRTEPARTHHCHRSTGAFLF